MATTRNALDKMVAGTSTRADFLLYFNGNMDILDAALAKCNFAAATDPTADDDEADGYVTGSRWHNTTGHKVFVCEDATETAAIWRQIWPPLPGGDVVGPASAVDADIVEFDSTTGKLVKDGNLTHANVADAISKKHTQAADDNFNGLNEKTSMVSADLTLIYSIADSAYRKMTLGNLKKLVLFMVGDSGTAQTITNDTYTKIAAGFASSAAFDTLSGWDGVNKKYICKEAGVYLCITQTLWYNTSTSGTVRLTEIYVNGTLNSILEGTAPIVGTSQRYPSIGWGLVTLAVNDYVELYVKQDSGGDIVVQYGSKMLLIRIG